MQNPSIVDKRDSWYQLGFGLVCLLVFSFAYALRLPGGILGDPFHEGEYFAALMTLLAGSAGPAPLTIHGALDYLPGLLAIQLFGPHRFFFPTWLIYQMASVVASSLLFLLLFRIAQNKLRSLVVTAAIAALSSQFVGYRDLVLLVSIALYFWVQHESKPKLRILLEAGLGLALFCGLSWSYDRGIVGVICLGAACLISVYRERTYAVSLLVFCAALVLFGLILEVFSISNYLSNIKVLSDTSYQWRYAWSNETELWTAFVLAFNVVPIGLLASAFRERWRSPYFTSNSIVLLGLSLLLLKIGCNRLDMPHVQMALWAPLMVGFYWYSSEQPQGIPPVFKAAGALLLVATLAIGFRYRVVVFIALCVLLGYFLADAYRPRARPSKLVGALRLAIVAPYVVAIGVISRAHSAGDYAWMNYLLVAPDDSAMVTQGVRWASQKLSGSGADCLFDLSNNGVINGLTHLPACSRFVYPVYADRHYEPELIAAVNSRRPKAIVYSSTYWSYNVDGKPMDKRFPSLDAYLREHYANETCSFGYCVRYLRSGHD